MDLRILGPAPGLVGSVRLPGDKSISHRALLFAGLAQGTSQLSGVLRSGVTEAMADCLRLLGVGLEAGADGTYSVQGGEWRQPTTPLDCGNSGTTMRMLLGALAGQSFAATLTGTARLRQRPMGRVAAPLREMGAEITGTNDQDAPPLEIRGGSLKGIEHHPRVASAQVKTAILTAGLFADGPTVVEEPGPSRDHTERLLRHLGVGLSISGRRVELQPLDGRLPAFSYTIPGDISSAAFLIVAGALVPGSKIELPGVGVNPTRTGLLDALAAMGAEVAHSHAREQHGEPVAEIQVRASQLGATDVSGDRVVRMIDEFPIFAVAATQAQGATIVSDAAELRVKESDRIEALATELRKMGAQIESRPDGFRIEGPTRLQAARVHSHGDHRLAMALAVAGLVAEGETLIEDAGCIHESFPGFTSSLADLGASFG